jgi:hypothetical protein
MRNKRLRSSRPRWRICERKTMMIVPIGTTSWRELVCSLSHTTTKGANWNIWKIWLERPRHSAALSVFNRVNTLISNFSRNLNFHSNRLDLNFDNRWHLAARTISGKWWAIQHRVFQFTMTAKSSVFMRARDSLVTKDLSLRFKIMSQFLLIDFWPLGAKRSFQGSLKSKQHQLIKSRKIPKQSCECRFTATWVETPTTPNFPSNKRRSSTKWTSVLLI